MLKIPGKTTSINVRKVLWTCEEAGLDYQQEDYGTGFASTQTDTFRAMNPNAMVPVLVIEEWNYRISIVEQQLRRTGAWAAGDTFTLADVVLGLSVNRWKMTPFTHPDVPAIDAWFARLNQRPAFLPHGNNGMV